ncbi:MAG TPA: divergent polysaccharide deacetylase family protein [Acetobacteraceae bacterium]
MLRALGFFWGTVLVILAAGAVTLQLLGPPQPPVVAATPAPAQPAAAQPASTQRSALAAVTPPPAAGAAIVPPDPALLEPMQADPAASLPRVAPDGRMPMRVYAAGFDPSDARPHIAVLVADIGMSGQDSEDAIRTLPAAVSLAFSPYAVKPDGLLALARAHGHESLIALPLEPQNAPLNDAGNFALLTGATPAANAQRLDWALSRISGYVGATGALGRLHGERFAAAADQMGPVLDELAARGLLYIDPRPARPGADRSPGTGPAFGRAVDLVIDEPALRTQVDAKLAVLEQTARDRGSALGLVDEPAPVTMERIASWATGLSQRGFVLTPVSALARPPAPTTHP